MMVAVPVATLAGAGAGGGRAVGQAVRCQQRAWWCSWAKQVLYSQHQNAYQNSLYFHSDYKPFGLLICKTQGCGILCETPLPLP